MYSILRNLGKREEYKLHDLSHWEKLGEVVTQPSVLLPEETKIFVEETHRVIKVNSKGKHQDRIIILTPKSILNIDPKSYSIKNERLLSEIEEVIAPTSNLDINMKFRPTTYQSLDDNGKPFFSGKSKEDLEKETLDPSYVDPTLDIDSIFRKYVMNSVEDRANLMQDLFETTVRSQFGTAPTAYKVIQVIVGEENQPVSHEEALAQMNRKKSRESRILKFGNDHILEVDKRSIKFNLPYIAVQYIELLTGDHVEDDDEKGASGSSKFVLIKLKHEGFHRLWKLKHCRTSAEDDLIASVREGVTRVKDMLKLRKARVEAAQKQEHKMKASDLQTEDEDQMNDVHYNNK